MISSRAGAQRERHAHRVRERERGRRRRGQSRRATARRGVAVLPAPARAGRRRQPVDRQAVVVARPRRVGGGPARARTPSNGVRVARQPVGPRVQERDPGRAPVDARRARAAASAATSSSSPSWRSERTSSRSAAATATARSSPCSADAGRRRRRAHRWSPQSHQDVDRELVEALVAVAAHARARRGCVRLGLQRVGLAGAARRRRLAQLRRPTRRPAPPGPRAARRSAWPSRPARGRCACSRAAKSQTPSASSVR